MYGYFWNGGRFEEGCVTFEDGKITDAECCRIPSGEKVHTFIPGIVDGHTHTADAGLKLTKKYSLEELVAPPNGLKHRYLSDTPKDVLINDMRKYTAKLKSNGVSKFIDFREGGPEGAKMLREASPDAVILGRPVSPEFDINEIDSILDVADGIGISSITDMDHNYIDKIADAVHRKNKMLALHVSERIREDIDYVLSLNPDFVVHMVQATKEDMRKCADADVSIVVCASSNQYFGMTPDIKMMIDAGASVSLGTDNAMLCPSADIFNEFGIFWKILSAQGGTENDAFKCLIAHGGKLLYRQFPIKIQPGNDTEPVIVPSSPDRILDGTVLR